MSLPMRRVPVSREGLYGVLAWLKRHRAARSPRAVRFELNPGQPVNIVLGKNSGPPSMDEWCEKLGVTATDEEKMAMLQAVKAKSFEKKDLLTTDEFKAIVASVLQKAAVS